MWGIGDENGGGDMRYVWLDEYLLGKAGVTKAYAYSVCT